MLYQAYLFGAHEQGEKELQEAIEQGYAEPGMRLLSLNRGDGSKTRRILEVQSFFQKVRDKEELVSSTKNTLQDEFSVSQEPDGSWSVIRNNPFEVIKSKLDSKENAKKEILNITNKNKENNFLQLLNKDSNWVTFFLKAVIQGSFQFVVL